MPANNSRHAPAQMPPSPSPRATTKYTNKDGSKVITVPKSATSTPPAQPSPTTTGSLKAGVAAGLSLPAPDDEPSAPSVNRKKQKRREKAAAKAAAERQADPTANGLPSPISSGSATQHSVPNPMVLAKHGASAMPSQAPLSPSSQRNGGEDWDDDETESDEEVRLHASRHDQAQADQVNGVMKSKKNKKKKKKGRSEPVVDPLEEAAASGFSKHKIWNTDSQEERERIKQFWLGLREEERKGLVKIEKDAVLKKMKEQQKHTCSCTVCGRKRTAIEEELEGLYDAYYQELESFANQPRPPPKAPMTGHHHHKQLGPVPGIHGSRGAPSRYTNHHPSQGRMVEQFDDQLDNEEEDEDEIEESIGEYSEGEDHDEEDELDEPEEIPRSYANDFFSFGGSLKVQGGILTVADDLLKNDGKKFIEMMEQLAERRMAREEDHYAPSYSHSSNGSLHPSHGQPPLEDDEAYEDEGSEEDEDDYVSEDDDYDEEEDTMTEEQRMEEGRRMFQIFAARMFEQRVLTAYKEKVAQERQQKLLQELEEEENAVDARKAKKAKDKERKKDKQAAKKAALAQEKARKEEQKHLDEVAEAEKRQAEEDRRLQEANAKAEEKRKQKKAEDEAKLKKMNLARERQAEQERKARDLKDAKERERKKKEEEERAARELKERETRERREKHEKDKREKEERQAHAKSEREAKEKQKQEAKAAQKPAAAVAPIPTRPAKRQPAVPAIPHHPPAHAPSPQVSVATPALPKAPTPMKGRSESQEVARSVSQASHSGSGPSQSTSPHALTPAHTSPGPIGPPSKTSSTAPSSIGLPPHPGSPTHASFRGPPPGLPQPGFGASIPPMGSFPPGIHPMQPGMRAPSSGFPPMGGNFPPPGMPFSPPPGLGNMGRGGFPMAPPPGFVQPPGEPLGGMSPSYPLPSELAPGPRPTHSRETSLSFDANPLDGRGPIGRPAPIGRPGSVVHGQRLGDRAPHDFDDLNSHLGSSALVGESDAMYPELNPSRRGTAAPGSRTPFSSAPFMDSFSSSISPLGLGWGAPSNPFSSPGPQGPPGFGNSAWPPNPVFGAPPPPGRPAQPRSVQVRLMLCRACKELENNAADANGFIDISAIKGHVDSINPPGAEPISEDDLLLMCETEGNAHNGGGSFDQRDGPDGRTSIRFDANGSTGHSPFSRNIGAPGEIGSPVVGGGPFGSRA